MCLLFLDSNDLLVHLFSQGPDDLVKVPYTLCKQEAVRGNVERIYSRRERLTGRFRAPITYPPPQDTAATEPRREVADFTTTLPAFLDPGLEELLIANGTEISAEPIQQDNTWLNLLFSFAPALLLIGLYVWFYRRLAKSGGEIGRAHV